MNKIASLGLAGIVTLGLLILEGYAAPSKVNTARADDLDDHRGEN
jgi:hypothetical protein